MLYLIRRSYIFDILLEGIATNGSLEFISVKICLEFISVKICLNIVFVILYFCYNILDRVFGPTTTTRHVYDVAAQHVVSGAMEGINGKDLTSYGFVKSKFRRHFWFSFISFDLALVFLVHHCIFSV